MLDLELAPRDRCEQVMEPEPLTVLIEGHQEHVRAFEVAQDPADPVVATRRRTVRAESVEDRDGDDEVTELPRLPTQHLFGEVVADEAVVAA